MFVQCEEQTPLIAAALLLTTKRRCCIYRGRIPQYLKPTTATVVNVGPETRPRTTTVPRAFHSDEVADSKDLLRAVRCVIPKSGRSVKVMYLGIQSVHERVWLVERKPIWLPRAYLTRGDLKPVRANLHICKFLRDLTNIQIRTVTAEWVDLFWVHLPDEHVTTQRRKEGRKEGRRELEGERGKKREWRNSYQEGRRKRSTQYALKLTTVSSLELIQESVSCCLLCPLLTTKLNFKTDSKLIFFSYSNTCYIKT